MCPYKGNLPPEYEIVHQLIVYQEKKQNMSNNLSLTTLNPDKERSNVSVQRQLTSWVWVSAPVDSVPRIGAKYVKQLLTHNTQS